MKKNAEDIRKEFLREQSKALTMLNDWLGKAFGEKEKLFYRVIPEKEVSERFLARAEKILGFCNKALKLRDVKIEWVQFAGSGDSERNKGYEIYLRDELVFGWADLKGNKVVIRHDVPLRDMELTLAHEMHHIWFEKKYGEEYPYDKESYMWEQAANSFAEKMLRKLWDKEHPDFTWPTTFLGSK